MLVRPMHINQFLAQRRKRLKRRGGTIDELAVCPGGSEDAFDYQLMIRACFQSILFKKRWRHAATVLQIENGFDRATIATSAQKRAVSPLAQQEVEGANDDGFARAGLAGDDVVAGLQLQGQIGNQRQILDTQRA